MCKVLKLNVLMGTMALLAVPALAQQPPDSVVSDAYNNTAMGSNALLNQTADFANAHDNTAAGASALISDSNGAGNTAFGSNALTFNTSGGGNTATGYGALYRNTTAEQNSAFGDGALNANTVGTANTASGYEALFSNTVGDVNTASGYEALSSNTAGSNNTGSGARALFSNTTGSSNTAVGLSALYSTSTGSSNTAIGTQALDGNLTGSNNIAMGYDAGSNITGSNDIDIGNKGIAADNGVIRIGTGGTQHTVYIAGIATKKITGSAVYVTAAGELGVLASSERYKTSIAPMAERTEKLRELRPVTFQLKSEPHGAVQYGLIAEEVDKVYPELVIRDEAGAIQGVRYDEISSMLLNEVQKQQQINAAQTAKIASLEQKIAEVDDLKQKLSAVLQELKARDNLVAQR